MASEQQLSSVMGRVRAALATAERDLRDPHLAVQAVIVELDAMATHLKGMRQVVPVLGECGDTLAQLVQTLARLDSQVQSLKSPDEAPSALPGYGTDPAATGLIGASAPAPRPPSTPRPPAPPKPTPPRPAPPPPPESVLLPSYAGEELDPND